MRGSQKQPRIPAPDVQELLDPNYTRDDFMRDLRKVTRQIAAPGLVATSKAAEPIRRANESREAFPEGNDGGPGAA